MFILVAAIIATFLLSIYFVIMYIHSKQHPNKKYPQQTEQDIISIPANIFLLFIAISVHILAIGICDLFLFG